MIEIDMKEQRAIKSCKDKYEALLPDVTLKFDNMAAHHTNEYEFTVTGTISYVDKNGNPQFIKHLGCQSVYG